ncbi:MAG: hypothetical protein RR071_03790 [Lachnospiraceae bacterium]
MITSKYGIIVPPINPDNTKTKSTLKIPTGSLRNLESRDLSSRWSTNSNIQYQ